MKILTYVNDPDSWISRSARTLESLFVTGKVGAAADGRQIVFRLHAVHVRIGDEVLRSDLLKALISRQNVIQDIGKIGLNVREGDPQAGEERAAVGLKLCHVI